MRVVVVPCLSDNYAYLLVDEAAGVAAVVDPSEAGPVLEALDVAGVASVCAVLVTHHHGDHVGGLGALRARWPDAPVFGHTSELSAGRIEGQTVGLADDEPFAAGPFTGRAYHVPGHTTGALAYAVGGALFTGDTLFRAGCGRLFEGTAATMFNSLQRLRALDPALAVYPGHEYTVKNLRFAQGLLPHDDAIATALTEALAQRDADRPTVGDTLARERRTNPFLRCDEALVQGALGAPGDPVAAFAALRARRDVY
jgi:hydroxyacylglutathione hydrolase